MYGWSVGRSIGWVGLLLLLLLFCFVFHLEYEYEYEIYIKITGTTFIEVHVALAGRSLVGLADLAGRVHHIFVFSRRDLVALDNDPLLVVVVVLHDEHGRVEGRSQPIYHNLKIILETA